MRLTALTVLTYVFTLQLCVAAPRAHHVMLSWKPSGQPWHFAFYSTLPLSYSLRDVTHPDMIVIGVPALKQRLSQHDPWRDIVWRDLVGTRPYPDVSTRDEICAFARTHGVNLEIVPDGFTIDVTADGADTTPVSLPLVVHADLTANPKGIENFPNLDSYLDAVVTEDGRFVVKDFHLGTRKQ